MKEQKCMIMMVVVAAVVFSFVPFCCRRRRTNTLHICTHTRSPREKSPHINNGRMKKKAHLPFKPNDNRQRIETKNGKQQRWHRQEPHNYNYDSVALCAAIPMLDTYIKYVWISTTTKGFYAMLKCIALLRKNSSCCISSFTAKIFYIRESPIQDWYTYTHRAHTCEIW